MSTPLRAVPVTTTEVTAATAASLVSVTPPCPHCRTHRKQIKGLKRALKLMAANFQRQRIARETERERLLGVVRREAHHIEEPRVHQRHVRGY